jgi:DNA-binding NarL/FixJ family response regulator
MPPILAKSAALLERLDKQSSLPLTRREQQVAELLAEGRTNREISARLYISERTAQNHVQHIMDKLGLHHRSQVALWVQSTRMSTATE